MENAAEQLRRISVVPYVCCPCFAERLGRSPGLALWKWQRETILLSAFPQQEKTGTFHLRAARLCLTAEPPLYSSAASKRLFPVVPLLIVNEAGIFPSYQG